jgi:hypothetical protein
MRTFEGLAIVVALCALGAGGAMGCGGAPGGGDDAAGTPDAASATPDAAGGGGDPDTGPRADTGPAMPGTPVLLSAMTVTHGNIALSWRLPDSGCDEVIINRNLDGGAFSEVGRLTGLATETVNFSGHGSGTFCYTMSCVLGGATGDPSNERCVTQ